MTAALPSFQRYQLQFTTHIRNPKEAPRPPHVSARRMQVYNEIVFNNLQSSVAACFPVAKKTLGTRAWHQLIRGFFAHHQCRSPLFRQIPEEFLRYLETAETDYKQPLPPYLRSLAHYEWIELALAVAEVSIDMSVVDVEGDLLEGVPALTPALALLNYDYPVQRISPRFKPKAPSAESVHLLVFRDAEDDVEFIEINQITARLLVILQTGDKTGRGALEQIATEIKHPDAAVILQFGQSVLDDLKAQGVILGVTLQHKSARK